MNLVGAKDYSLLPLGWDEVLCASSMSVRLEITDILHSSGTKDPLFYGSTHDLR
ncbi:hypothetical protein GGD46_002160 [Rhizobium lusitanum]|uniref:Uncharacterized protein n=1 Tax=Rhizobium lusitanum TaxID=293958 RepID=A0A7X0IPX0_9HYPH|nr:hypothetical protein [Rhizobium lusitanum]